MNRDFSFYGTFGHREPAPRALALQARLDPNAYNRVDAFRQLTDRERIRFLLNPGEEVGGQWLELYGEILAAAGMPHSLRAYFLRIDEQPMNRSYATWYQELVVARENLMLAVNRRYRDRLLEAFSRLDACSETAARTLKGGIEARMLKQVLLDLIAIDDSEDSLKIILNQFYAAKTVTERVGALLALNRSSSRLRRKVLEEAYEAWHENLSGYANYLRVVASGTREDVFAMIEAEKNRPGFDITQPTWSRALFLPMAVNNKMVWTDEGIRWVTRSVIELAPINATTTGRLLNTFQQVQRLRPPLKEKVKEALEKILQQVSEEASPAVYGQAKAYLSGT